MMVCHFPAWLFLMRVSSSHGQMQRSERPFGCGAAPRMSETSFQHDSSRYAQLDDA